MTRNIYGYFFLSDLYSNDKCTEKLKFIFIDFVVWMDHSACHHILDGETGRALEVVVSCSVEISSTRHGSIKVHNALVNVNTQ